MVADLGISRPTLREGIALMGLTTTLARELGPVRINVNAIAPCNAMSDAGRALTPEELPFVQS